MKAAEILSESEQRYRELANCLPDIVFETNLNGQLEFANERASEISGYSLNEIERGINILQFIAAEDRDRATKNIQRLLSGGSYVPSEYKFMRKDGTTFPALITATSRISENKMTGLRGMVIDITERKKTEDSLKESEEKFRTLSEQSPNMIFINKRGKVIYTNKKCEDTTGYTREEFYSPNFDFLSLCAPEYVEEVKLFYAKQMRGEAVASYECVLVTREGERINAIITTKLMDYEGEKAILGIVTDITERRRTEEKVRFEAERLERVMENSQDLIMLTKPDGSVIYVNSALRKITGYSETEFIGKNLWIVHPEDSDMAKEVFGRILKGENVEFEHRIITKDGQTKWVIHSCSPIIREGKVSELVSTIRDITERKKNQDILRRKEQELEDILDSSPTIVFYKDLNGKFILTNKAFAQALNTTKDNLLGKTVFDIYSKKIAKEMIDDDNVVLKSKIPKLNIVEPYESPTGLRWIRTHKVPTFDEKGEVTGLIGFSEEITDYKKAEAELKESLNNYHSLINGMNETAWVIDFEGNFLEVNEAAVNVLGYSKDELLSKGIEGIGKHLSRIQVQELMNTLRSNKKQIFETIHTTKDGVEIPVEISSSLITYQGKQMILSIARDITLRKKAEEALKKNQVKMEIMNEKLNVVGRLTRHDVGNKLMIVKSNIYLLKKQIGDNPKLAKYLEGIDFAINQSDEMFEFSRFYEKIGVEQPSEIDVAQCFNQAATLLPNLGTLKVVNDCQGLYVTADSLLKQLFYNFLDNSLKYGEKVTQIRLHFTKEGDGMKLFYEDDGVGIPEANRQKLFHEGFTTGKGTGLGLFLIKKMVQVYGWTISEEGEPGKGVKFFMTIPKLGKNGKENYQIAK